MNTTAAAAASTGPVAQLETTDGTREQTVEQQAQSAEAPCRLWVTHRVAAVVQQIMMAVNGAESEQVKIVAVTKIVIDLLNLNGHSSTQAS
jgi:hypothetical protein